MKKSGIIAGIIIAAELAAGFALMGEEMTPVLKWWLMMLALGIGTWPLTARLFSTYSDKGYVFGKILGGIAAAWLLWFFASLKLLKFSMTAVVIITLLTLIGWWVLSRFVFKKDTKELLAEVPVEQVLIREAIFTAAFIFFCYVKCYNPDAYGTERMMDYGFMQSIFRSEYFPPQDFWFAGENLNYYYFGQYFCTFLTKLSFNEVSYGYNLALAMCFALCLSFSFSLVYQLMLGNSGDKKKAVVAGTLAAMVLPGAASLHYLLFNFIVPWTWDILAIPGEKPSYWYADSTRYIGYHPETNDRTAHEYPAYSFLLGDLHAHVINIFVVLTILALLYAWIKDDEEEAEGSVILSSIFASELRKPRLWVLSFLTGICVMENFWDFPIYFVVSGAVLLAVNMRRQIKPLKVASVTALQGVVVLLVSLAVSLLFQINFKAMANGIKPAENHTPIYQLAVLWALPLSLLTGFAIAVISRCKGDSIRNRLRSFGKTDLYVLLIGLCGAGLVLIPEIIYIEDIYSGDFKRFNTMFKLSYQAFIMLNLMMCYVVSRFVMNPESRVQRKWGIISGVILVLCCGYFITALRMSAGDIKDTDRFMGLRADDYLYREAPYDADAVYWARENIPSGSVVLEANGDSYTIYNRVSVITGLPTVLGWHTHEWLWHNDLDPVDERVDIVRRMYVDADRALMEAYGVDYIFVGSCEYEKYEREGMDIGRLLELGETVYSGDVHDDGKYTFIIRL
ncbi:MAG: hypothetical protein J6X66_06345 [Lachnospiraceae bacterium]|nr:hypothetical protein [Lachnospiraceae bacterium]